MKQDTEGRKLFQEVLDETPREIRQQVEWSYDIADKIYEHIQQLGMSKKEFARRMGTSEAAVTKWISGGYNFTLSTLAKISTKLGEPLLSVNPH